MKKQLLFVGILSVALAGCSSAPGTSGQQGAVVGGATGAAVGASVTKNRALGAVIGGAAGAVGGYEIGKKTGPLDKRGEPETPPAQGSAPVTSSGGATSTYPSNNSGVTQTADLNNDGFVTLDEIAKMQKSGLSDEEMLRRIAATGRTFDLNDEQRKYLVDHGVHQTVIEQLPAINRTTSAPGSTVISR